MIFELRTYTLRPGTQGDCERRAVRGDVGVAMEALDGIPVQDSARPARLEGPVDRPHAEPGDEGLVPPVSSAVQGGELSSRAASSSISWMA